LFKIEIWEICKAYVQNEYREGEKMITLKPFEALRPKKELVEEVVAPPYDVIDTVTAREIGKNPKSLVHVTRSEIHFDKAQDPYSKDVYQNARQTLDKFQEKGILFQEEKKCYYIYRQIMNGRAQNGIVGCASIDDYKNGKIKRHEFTRVDKEQDRINHFYACEANTEPVFLFYNKDQQLKKFIAEHTKANEPEYDIVTDDGVAQILWVVDEVNDIEKIESIFGGIEALYIADGHHRTASAYNVGMMKRKENPDYTGQENFNYFMSVVFSSEELFIMPYNRLVKDMNGMIKDEFVEKIKANFDIKKIEFEEKEKIDQKLKLIKVQPKNKNHITMIMEEQYYRLIPKEGSYDKYDIIASLDTSILQDNLLSPVLGIEDPRTDKRIEFFGGENMLEEMEAKLLVRYRHGLGFLLYPTQIEDIIKVSDISEVMPPKSTWFEPKLKSGLLIHKF